MEFNAISPVVFSAEELEQIEETMIHILEEVGILVQHDALRDRFKNLRYKVNDKRVCIEKKLVQNFITEERAYNGRYFKQGPIQNKLIDTPFTIEINDYAQNLHDHKSDKIIPFTTQSLIEATKLLDVLYERGVTSSPPGLPPDIPAPLQSVFQYWVAATYSRQGRVPMDPKALKSFPYVREMSDVLGCPLKKLDVWVISPLTLGGESLESVLCYADQLDSVSVSNMGAIGTTLPINVGDAFAVAMAEVIGSTVLLREVLDVSFSWNTFLCTTDFRSAAMVTGSPENILLGLLNGQVGAFIHGQRWQPAMGHSMMTMAKLPGPQSCAEKASGMTAGALLGQRNFKYGGSLVLDEVYSAEQLMYDLEIKDHVRRIVRGMESNCDLQRCLNDIHEALEQGSFLGLESTLRSFRNYFWDPFLFERNSLNTWRAKGQNEIRERTRHLIDNLIHQHEYELETDLQKEINRVLNNAKYALI